MKASSGGNASRRPAVPAFLLASMIMLAPASPVLAQGGHGGHGDGGFNSGNLTQGASWEHEFTAAGRFDYVCHPHPFMKGEVLVSDSDPAAATGTIQVRIQNFSFLPQTLVIKPGTVVRWTNEDNVTHTVTQEIGEKGFTIFGLPWWQGLLAGAALVVGVVLMFVRPKKKPRP